jgi:hypothetical protein
VVTTTYPREIEVQDDDGDVAGGHPVDRLLAARDCVDRVAK